MGKLIPLLLLFSLGAQPAIFKRNTRVKLDRRLVRVMAIDVAAGFVAGYATKRATKPGPPTITIFGPGTPTVSAPKAAH